MTPVGHNQVPSAPPAAEPELRRRLQALYDEEFARMERFAAARLGDRTGAADVVNDAFVQALAKLDGLRDGGALHGWVWSILVNQIRMTRRRSRWMAARRAVARAESVDVIPEVDHEVRDLMRRLPGRQRTVLFLKYYGDLSNTTIAEALGISPGTVGATLHQAHASLRRMIDEGTG